MISAVTLVSAGAMGLLGGAHCIVMCGGVAAMTGSAAGAPDSRVSVAALPYVLAYNAGRVGSYGVAGAASGALGATLVRVGAVLDIQLGLRALAAVLTIAVGMYVAGLSGALPWAERAGAPVWRRMAPLAHRMWPARSPRHALALGILWGWMPCGLVYGALATAVTAGSAAGGALTMLAFGSGTLPALVAMGAAARALAHVARRPAVRGIAGAVLVMLGVYHLVASGQASVDLARGIAPICCLVHRYGL